MKYSVYIHILQQPKYEGMVHAASCLVDRCPGWFGMFQAASFAIDTACAPFTTRTIIFVGSHYKAFFLNYTEPTKKTWFWWLKVVCSHGLPFRTIPLVSVWVAWSGGSCLLESGACLRFVCNVVSLRQQDLVLERDSGSALSRVV